MRNSWQRLGQPLGGECEPRFITPRNPARESIGKALIATAMLLNRFPLPWQEMVFDRAFEVDECGCLWYREIVVVVPRQSGKTTLVVPWGVHRCTTWPERQVVLYTAQSRIKAREKWIEDQVYLIKKSAFRLAMAQNRQGRYEPNLSHGEEHIKWANDSKWGVDAPTETAGHGPTLDLGIIDEAFSQVDGRVEQAMSPAMITRNDSQKLIVSTAGKSKARSPFLWGKIEAGRNRVEAGLDSRTLFVEFSAGDDVDWLDPLVWWQTMPALGYTVTEDKVAAEADSLDEEEFRRAYLNQWGDDLATDSKIPLENWHACQDADSEISDRLTWVVDISPERSWASISLAAQRDDGLVHIETVERWPGTDWIIDGDPTRATDELSCLGLVGLLAKYGGELYYDHVTVGALVPAMEAAGLNPIPIPAQDIKVSAAALFDAVVNGRVRHVGQEELTDALIAAATRKFGDGWAWTRGASMADITALVSATLAHWMLAKTLPDLNYDPMSGIG